MTIEQYITSFEKYIEEIILPNHPEIVDFNISISDRMQWNFVRWLLVVKITFYFNGSDENLQDWVRGEMETMKRLFLLDVAPSKREFEIHWRFIVDGKWNEEWEM